MRTLVMDSESNDAPGSPTGSATLIRTKQKALPPTAKAARSKNRRATGVRRLVHHHAPPANAQSAAKSITPEMTFRMKISWDGLLPGESRQDT